MIVVLDLVVVSVVLSLVTTSFSFVVEKLESQMNIEQMLIRVRQRSGEGVVWRNGRAKGCFWRVRFLSAPLRFALTTLENLNGAEKKRALQNTLLDDHFSARRLRRSFCLVHPQLRVLRRAQKGVY